MRENFVWLAILVAVPLLLAQFLFGIRTTAEEQGIPLLTVLIMNEFGAVLCAIAAGVGINQIKKAGIRVKPAAAALFLSLLAMVFIWRLLMLYPATA